MTNAITNTDPSGDHGTLTESDLLLNLASSAYFVYDATDRILEKTPDGFYTVPMAVEIKEGIATLAQAVMAILLVVQLISELDRKGDDFRWQDGVKIAAEFVILKVIIEMHVDILAAMLDSATKLVTGSGVSLSATICDVIAEVTEGAFSDVSGVFSGVWRTCSELVSLVGVLLIALVLYGIGVVVGVIVICRLIQLAMMTLFAALPISFIIWHETRDITKRFFLSYFAVCLQGAMIYLIFGIYVYIDNTFMPDVGLTGALGHIFALIVLASSVVKSGAWAKEFLGVA